MYDGWLCKIQHSSCKAGGLPRVSGSVTKQQTNKNLHSPSVSPLQTLSYNIPCSYLEGQEPQSPRGPSSILAGTKAHGLPKNLYISLGTEQPLCQPPHTKGGCDSTSWPRFPQREKSPTLWLPLHSPCSPEPETRTRNVKTLHVRRQY